MSVSNNTPKQESQGWESSRRRIIGGLLGLFLCLGIVWAGYWLVFLSSEEFTDNAYVAGNQVRIAPLVSGTVLEIFADDTQAVTKGQLLARLDDTDARIALERARAGLADAVRQISSIMSESDRLRALVRQKETELAQAHEDYARRKRHRTAFAVSEEELSHARDAVTIAEAALEVATFALASNRALLQDASLAEQPLVLLRANELRDAWLALKRCDIISPVDGYVARRTVQVGMYVSPGTPLMAVVPLHDVWVTANFKERQLDKVRVGQPVTIQADMYGSSVTYKGTVAGLVAGTGSSFSLLPPENATGNWIKVVQRVPIKILLDTKDQLEKYPLLIGLSCGVTIDVSNTDGLVLAKATPGKVVYATSAPVFDMSGIEEEIKGIISTNAAQSQ